MQLVLIRILLLSFLLALSACSLLGSGNDSSVRSFTAYVDSISVSASIQSTDTLAVSLHGWLGRNGCCSFERFEAKREPSSLELEVIGSAPAEGATCTTVMVPLPPEYEIAPPLVGPFDVMIRQPDDSTLKRIVEVEAEQTGAGAPTRDKTRLASPDLFGSLA